MKLLLLFIATLLLAAAIATYTADESGYVIITVLDWTIQTSAVFFLASLIVLFVLLYFSIRLLFAVWDAPGELKRWKKLRRQQLSEKYLNRGLLALVEGRWKAAEEALIKGVRYTNTPLINYLCAARAAQRQGKITQRDHYLELAHAGDPDAKIALGLTRAELQINQQQAELALATLTHLHEQQPGQQQVKVLLLRTYTDLGAWEDILQLLPELERERLLPRENIAAAQLQAYAGLLRKAGNSASKKQLEKAWEDIPKKLRKELHLLEVYTREKLKFADTEDCEPLLRQALKIRWDTEIVRLYGLVEGMDPAKQLAFAESLQAGHARDPVLLLTLGRLSLRNSLWGKAATYLRECIEIQPMPEAYRELAMLMERQGDYSAASTYYQKGLALATTVARHDSVKLLEQAEDEVKVAAGARQVV
jgi:HemY protein